MRRTTVLALVCALPALAAAQNTFPANPIPQQQQQTQQQQPQMQPLPLADPNALVAAYPAPPAFAGAGLNQPASTSASDEVPSGPVRVSGGVMAGQAVAKVDPIYPASARAAHISGAVVLAALIGKNGTVSSLSVVSGPPMLRVAAINAVKQWTYRPFLLNGEPVEVNTTVTVNFKPQPPEATPR